MSVFVKVSNLSRAPLLAPSRVGNFRCAPQATAIWEMSSAAYFHAQSWLGELKTASWTVIQTDAKPSIEMVNFRGASSTPFEALGDGEYLCLALCSDGRHRVWAGPLITRETEYHVSASLHAALVKV